MEQRPLRLGDLVDDYCPRERRVTNHAIVAIVNNTIRQTRCTTCEAEHVFKDGKPPRRRTKPADSVGQPAVDNSGGQLVAPSPLMAAPEPEDLAIASSEVMAETNGSHPAAETEVLTEEPAENGADAEDLWSGHRPLIRATLPRSESDVPPPRPIPEFTIYQRHNGRAPGGFRQGRGAWPDRGGQGARGDRQPGAGGGHGHSRRRHGKKRPR